MKKRYRKSKYRKRSKLGNVMRIPLLLLLLAACGWQVNRLDRENHRKEFYEAIPAQVQVYEQAPVFAEEDMALYTALTGGEINAAAADDGVNGTKYIRLAELDALGRCGAALMCAGPETLAAGERGDISGVRPSGWHNARYPELIEDVFLYNRCHLLGFQLCGLNEEPRNLITGTDYLNKTEMLLFENEVAGYIRRTGNHVMYRVTPLFKGDEAVARRVRMEALSVEDDGAGVCFFAECANAQPGVEIDYATGESREVLSESAFPQEG